MKSNHSMLCGLGCIAMLISSYVVANDALTHRGYTFEIKGMSQEEQIVKFDSNSKECEAEADKQYKKNMDKAELLSKIYGQKMDQAQFKQLADAQFIECMTGFSSK